jgi:hypothetical protein
MGLVEEVVGPLRGPVEGSFAEAVLERMWELEALEGPIDLRLGEYLAMLFGPLDPRKIDHTNFGGFASEELDMDRTWAGRIMALGRSELSLVKEALCRGWIPLSTAVLAVKNVDPEDQEEWIAGVRSGDIRPRKRKPVARVDIEEPEKAAFVNGVFHKARVVMGYRATDPEVERHIVRVYRERRSGKKLVNDAQAQREPPPKRTTPFDPLDDPAAPFLGPRVMPRDEKHCLELIRETLRMRRMRRLELAALRDYVVEHRLYRELGFRNVKEMVNEHLRLSVRSLEEYSKELARVTYYPELEEALAEGMDVVRLLAISDIATEDNVARWLAVARRIGVTELRRAVAWAEEATSEYVLGLYERAIEETQDAHTWVALKAARSRSPKPPRRIDGVHPELYDACVYYDREVELPDPKGFPSVRRREGFCCENPLCNCVSLRNEGHHWKLRKHGGSNAPTNAGCLCKPCHRRGIHAGAFTKETDAKGRDVWTYLSGRRVMVF